MCTLMIIHQFQTFTDVDDHSCSNARRFPDRGRRTLHIKGYNEDDSELPSASILLVQNSMPVSKKG